MFLNKIGYIKQHNIETRLAKSRFKSGKYLS